MGFTYRAEGNHSGEGHEEFSEITTSPSAKTIKQTKKNMYYIPERITEVRTTLKDLKDV